eukprot:m.391577 g.391577  ORF g.391577 m.391577 type:complete len:67 (+) comp56346_c0_seq31:1983-2183(+)
MSFSGLLHFMRMQVWQETLDLSVASFILDRKARAPPCTFTRMIFDLECLSKLISLIKILGFADRIG